MNISQSVGYLGVNRHDDVEIIQSLLNANIRFLVPLAPLVQDGEFGDKTGGAIRFFQERVVQMQSPSGLIEPLSISMQMLTQGAAGNQPPNMTAWFEVSNRAGQRRQMMSGRLTVNQHTYYFRSGGHGRGNLPAGQYDVTPHLWDRSENGFSKDGVGYSFALNDKYDARVGDTRTLLRIHPDGGTAGTNGCIGIVGYSATQTQFREDMRAELTRGNNTATLTVQNR